MTPKKIICTLFDHRYLPRGLCLIRSIRRHSPDQEIRVLCLSAECEQALARIPLAGVKAIPLRALESHIPDLLAAKASRQAIEYYFTCMAALHRYIFDTEAQVDGTMYVDADMYFYTSPGVVFDAIGAAPAAVIPHNLPPVARAGREQFGLYNAGWSAFRRDPEGEKCLNWWLERSLEWCYDRVDEKGRYANQAYLNRFPVIAPNTKILRQKGFNCAPWNIGGYRVSLRDGRILVDDEPLVFFHFHGVKQRYGLFYFDCHREYGAPMLRLVRNHVYRPYIRALVAANRETSAALGAGRSPSLPPPLAHHEMAQQDEAFHVTLPRRLRGKSLEMLNRMRDLAAGRPILVLGDHIW